MMTLYQENIGINVESVKNSIAYLDCKSKEAEEREAKQCKILTRINIIAVAVLILAIILGR